MSLSIVQQASNANSNSAATVAVAYPGSVTSGNLLVIAIAAQLTVLVDDVSSVTDTQGNTWVKTCGIFKDPVFGSLAVWIYSCTANGTGANTVTVTMPRTSWYAAQIYEVNSSTGGTWGTDGTATGATGTTANPSAGSIVTTATESFLVAICANNDAYSTNGAGWTQDGQMTIQYYSAAESRITSAAGTYTGSFINAGTATWAAAVAGFTVAGSSFSSGNRKLVKTWKA